MTAAAVQSYYANDETEDMTAVMHSIQYASCCLLIFYVPHICYLWQIYFLCHLVVSLWLH